MPLSIALDYSVLDHLQKLGANTYEGAHTEELGLLKASAERGDVAVWTPEISLVEMLHGLENVAHRPDTHAFASAKDEEKRAIFLRMSGRMLGYPCSKLDDTYSRLNVSFRLAGPESEPAAALENRLLQVDGVSEGDARQLVSCAFPFDSEQVHLRPHLDWLVSEDQVLVDALNGELRRGALGELALIRVGNVADLVGRHPNIFQNLLPGGGLTPQ